jgi:hypothetical protein
MCQSGALKWVSELYRSLALGFGWGEGNNTSGRMGVLEAGSAGSVGGGGEMVAGATVSAACDIVGELAGAAGVGPQAMSATSGRWQQLVKLR